MREHKELKEHEPDTYVKHNCKDYRNTVYVNSEHYNLEKCMICDTVVDFRWKSFWKRFKNIF